MAFWLKWATAYRFRAFIKKLLAADHAGVWDVLADQSRFLIAQLIGRAARPTLSPVQVLDMLNKDVGGLRKTYFQTLRRNIHGVLNDIYKCRYDITVHGQFALVTIKSRDFKVVKQGGKWRIDFFTPLYRNAGPQKDVSAN